MKRRWASDCSRKRRASAHYRPSGLPSDGLPLPLLVNFKRVICPVTTQTSLTSELTVASLFPILTTIRDGRRAPRSFVPFRSIVTRESFPTRRRLICRRRPFIQDSSSRTSMVRVLDDFGRRSGSSPLSWEAGVPPDVLGRFFWGADDDADELDEDGGELGASRFPIL